MNCRNGRPRWFEEILETTVEFALDSYFDCLLISCHVAWDKGVRSSKEKLLTPLSLSSTSMMNPWEIGIQMWLWYSVKRLVGPDVPEAPEIISKEIIPHLIK